MAAASQKPSEQWVVSSTGKATLPATDARRPEKLDRLTAEDLDQNHIEYID